MLRIAFESFLQVLAGNKLDGLARWNNDGLAAGNVAGCLLLGGADLEGSEATQVDVVTLDESVTHYCHKPLDGAEGVDSGEAGLVGQAVC